MKKVIVALVLAAATAAAFAACPTYSPYRCIQGSGGKMICGCGV